MKFKRGFKKMSNMTLSMLVRAKDTASGTMQKLAGKMRQTQTASQKLAQRVQRVGRSFGLFRKNTERARDELGRFVAQSKTAEKSAGRLRKALGGALMAGGLAMGGAIAMNKVGAIAATTMNYEASIDKVAAVANIRKGSKDYNMLDRQAKELGASTSFSASQAAEGQQYLAMAGFDASQINKAMPGMLDLAKGGDTDLATTADIASNILSGFKMEAEDMGKLGDVLAATFTTSNTNLSMLGDTMKYVAPVASKMGGSVEEVAAMSGLLGNVGIQGSQAGTSLRSLYSRMAAPPKMARDAMNQIGLNIKKANGEMKSMPELLEEIHTKTLGMDKDQQMEIFKKIAGQEALAAMAELVDQAGSGALMEYIESLEASQGVSERVAKQMSDNLKGDITALGSIKEGLQITMGELFMGNMRGGVQAMTGMLQSLNRWIKMNPRLAKTLGSVATILTTIGVVAGGVALFGPILAAAFSPVLLPIMAIAAGAGLIIGHWDQVGGYFSALGQNFKWSFIAVKDGFKAFFKGDWAGLNLALSELKREIGYFAQDIWSGVEWAAPQIDKIFNLEEGTTLATIQAVWSPIQEFFNGFFEGFSNSLKPVVSSFEDFWKSIKGVGDAFSNLFDTLFSGSETDTGKLNNLGQALGEIAAGSLKIFVDLLSLGAQGLIAIIDGAAWLIENGQKAFSWLTGKTQFNEWENAHHSAASAIEGHVSALSKLTGSKEQAIASIKAMTEAERQSAMQDANIGMLKAQNARRDILDEALKIGRWGNIQVEGFSEIRSSFKDGTATGGEVLNFVERYKDNEYINQKDWFTKLTTYGEALKKNDGQMAQLNRVRTNLNAYEEKDEAKPKPQIVAPPSAEQGYASPNTTNQTNETNNISHSQTVNNHVEVVVNEAQNMSPQDIGNSAAEALADQARMASNDGGAY